MCAYLWFLVISNEREIDASHQRMHTLDLTTKVRPDLHQLWTISDWKWWECSKCCVSRIVEIPQLTRCHVMICTCLSDEFTNTALSLQIPWSISFRNVTFVGYDIFLQMKNKDGLCCENIVQKGHNYCPLKNWTPWCETVWPQSKLGAAVKNGKRKRMKCEKCQTRPAKNSY